MANRLINKIICTIESKQPQRSFPPLPLGILPRQLHCACGKYFADYAQFRSGKWNTMPHIRCKTCHLKNKPPRHCFPKHNLLETGPQSFVAAAKASFSAHPRLNIRISMPSLCGFDVDIHGAVVDSGAQVCLLPEQAIRDLQPVFNAGPHG